MWQSLIQLKDKSKVWLLALFALSLVIPFSMGCDLGTYGKRLKETQDLTKPARERMEAAQARMEEARKKAENN